MDQSGSSTSVGASSPGLPTYVATPVGDDLRIARETLAKAARAVNQANFAGAGREVTFSIDAATRRPIVKVVETDTKEVIAQWPSEYLLRLAQELDRAKGTHNESH